MTVAPQEDTELREQIDKTFDDVKRRIYQLITDGYTLSNIDQTDVAVKEAIAKDIARYITDRDEQREREIRIDENKYWLTVLSPSFDDNVAYMSDFNSRIKELTQPPKHID